MKYILDTLPVNIKDKEERYQIINKKLHSFVIQNNNQYPITVNIKKDMESVYENDPFILMNINDIEYRSETLSFYNSFMTHKLELDYLFQDIGLVDKAFKRFNSKEYGDESSFKEFIDNNPRAYFDLPEDVKEIHPILNKTIRWSDFSNVESFIKIYGIVNPKNSIDYELNNMLFECYENDKTLEDYDDTLEPGLSYFADSIKNAYKRYCNSLEKEKNPQDYLSLRSLESYFYYWGLSSY